MMGGYVGRGGGGKAIGWAGGGMGAGRGGGGQIVLCVLRRSDITSGVAVRPGWERVRGGKHTRRWGTL